MKKVLLICFALISILSATTAVAQPGTITKIVGSGVVGYNGEGVIDTLANFNSIHAFCKDGAGNIYIADGNNCRIRKVDAVTHLVTTIAGTGINGYSGDGGLAPLAKVTQKIIGIAIDHSGNVLFTDSNRIRKINTTTGIITTVVGGGSNLTDGISATAALLSQVTGLYLDSVDNIYFGDWTNRIRKVNAVTGLISTLAGSVGAVGFGGDGGPATSATLHGPSSVTMDRTGNIYFADGVTNRIRKINTSGIISTIAGNGSASSRGDGGLAINASVHLPAYQLLFGNIQLDTAGNLYFIDFYTVSESSHFLLRQINLTTGVINKVAGAMFNTATTLVPPGEADFGGLFFSINPDGSILFTRGAEIYNLSRTYSAIKTMSVTDTMYTAPCIMRAQTGAGIYAIVNGTPAPGDSVHIRINYGDDAATRVTVPYWSVTDTATGGLVYGFGASTNWLPPHSYLLPGDYQPVIYLSMLNGYQQIVRPAIVHASGSCDDNILQLGILSIKDTITSPPCTSPAYTRCTIKGFVIGNVTTSDSVYIKIASTTGFTDIFVVPIDVAATYSPLFADSIHMFSYVYVNAFVAHTYIPGAAPYYENDVPYDHRMITVISNNGLFTDHGSAEINQSPYWPYYYDSTTYIPGMLMENCINTSIEGGIIVSTDSTAFCPSAVPYLAHVKIQGRVHGTAVHMTSFPVHIWLDDVGIDTVVTCTIEPSFSTLGDGAYSFSSPSFDHLYTMEGDHTLIGWVDTAVPFYTDILPFDLHLITSCTPVTGTFYIDANHNCTADTGEVRLAHWPFVLVNHTTGDTTNAWADDSGSYHLSLSDTNSYTIIPNHASYFGDGGAGDSLVVSCPAAGVYNVTAAPGVSFSQDFAFNCMGAASTVDMSVAGWGWGFIPGDTGIISIWSSDSWGYMCDSLSATVTLTIDTNLTYIGMWTGPLPTTVTGNVLTWTFFTGGNLFDFTASVKVECATTAMMGDTARNMLHISPTSMTDPYLANNTYSWSEAIRSSFDPNEKEVSPKGFGDDGYIENGTPLSYMIHFQNSGTAPARHIKVIDTISANLDLATLQIVSSSDPVAIYQTGPHTVQFRFTDINLPDSMSDPEGSKGFVAFNILPIDNLPAGTQIVNGAGIYFDYNPPIYTNVTLNTIEDTVRAIAGADAVCVGADITLTNTLAGGVWSATNSNAIVTGGVVTGVTPGIDTIMYTVYGDKTVSKIITINPLPDAGTITGTAIVCAASATTLADTATGGTWSSSSATATVAAGVVTGVSAGTAIISYAVTNSCGTATDTMIVTISPLPIAGTITGVPTVCEAATTTLTNAATGGIWSSSAATATVTGGIVTGATAGTSLISYTVINSCGTATDTMMVTINPLPIAGAITGIPTVCEAATTTLANTVTGGTWSSSTATATVAGGVVTAATAGTTIISYAVTNSCGTATDTMLVTINPLPNAGTITGIPTVCEAATTILANTATGGVWTSSSAGATVTAGIVTGITAGTTTISYDVTNSCGTAIDTMMVTINPLPIAGTITGIATVCEAAATTLTNTVTTGVWSSSSAIASVAGGIVTGVSTGSVIISYAVSNSCGVATDTMLVTINAVPNAGTITGPTAVCAGMTITLANLAGGGIWSSSSADATIAGSTVTGVTPGATTISYTVTNSCGTAVDTMMITVSLPPDAGTITGTPHVCQGQTTTLTNAVAGGIWSSSSADVIVAGGVVTGVTAGTSTVSYAVTNGCGTTTDTIIVTVDPLPDAGTIAGSPDVCEGTTTTLITSVTGGTWSSSSTDATVAGGVVTGVTPGTATISYIVTNSCGTDTVTHTVTVLSTADCSTGVANTAQADQLISIYPNPSNGSFTVEIPQPGNDATITVTDVSGKVVATIKPTANDRIIPVYLTNLASGTYLIKVTADGRVYRDKVVLW